VPRLRFPIWTLLLIVPVAALVLAAGYSLGSEGLEFWFVAIVGTCFAPMLVLTIFFFLVLMMNRGDPPPR
jgi:hypothetical protein